ncbi:pentatricopeptide repeat-containing protein At3g02330, mitochondrial [Silene latifolia]|uniref:pentatricopeptide repeat-containing protein At3g02330, mitochondrial n=1 Tax=Silene latifolia TaxID=37657 RepID=UPI003D774CF3
MAPSFSVLSSRKSVPILLISPLTIAKFLSPFLPKISFDNVFKSMFMRQIYTAEHKLVTPTKKKTFSHIFQECTHQRALNPGKQAHSQMIVSGFRPTVFVANCLIQMYIKCSRIGYAHKVFDFMPQRDTISWNSMIFGYSGEGKIDIAQILFDSMPERDVVSWNTLISSYLRSGDHRKCVGIFLEIVKEGVCFDHATLAVVLKCCSVIENYKLGVQIHGRAVKSGFSVDMVSGSALVDMYAKCKYLDESLRFFFEMPEKNWVCWSAIIAGFVQNNQFFDGLELFKEMQRQGVGVSQSTYASVFRSCAGLSAIKVGCQLHAHALKTNFGKDIIVATATLDMYAKCQRLVESRKVFMSISRRTIQSYNAMLVGYVQSNQGSEALLVFQHMRASGLLPDEVTLSGAFSGCAMTKNLSAGCQLHGLVMKYNFRFNVCVANAILDMYGKCGDVIGAQGVFDEMTRRDAVSWNAIIAAYEQNGLGEETLRLFSSMLDSGIEPDEFTYGSVLKACTSKQHITRGIEVHGRVIKSGMGFHPFVGSTIVDMYCKYGKIDEAMKLHYRLEEQNMVSWNAIISGFLSQDQNEEAQRIFSRMLEMGTEPDNFTYATVLDACANIATVGLGKQIHAQIIKYQLQGDAYIVSTLVDMYSKCGLMLDSQQIFERALERDFVTWNAMICGYAYHGFAEEALKVFEDMKREKVKPNHATFVAVLRACGHMGLVEKGWAYFCSMCSYGLDPQLEHYSCMVDILGKSGQIRNALKLIEDMPFEADHVIWRTLLSVCKMYGNVEDLDVAEKAADVILKLDPQDSSVYILLANIYADAGMWDQVSRLRKAMRKYKVKKEPGCSWIEVKGDTHTFLANEKAHPNHEAIREELRLIYNEMSLSEYILESDISLNTEIGI